MPLTIDQNTINAALRLFSITAQDYYLEFTAAVIDLEFTAAAIYMHWIADSSLITSYLQGNFVALDIQVKGVWHQATEMDSVPAGHYNCRYILETN